MPVAGGSSWVDPGDRVVAVVGDPDRAGAGGDAERPLADRDRRADDAAGLRIQAGDAVVVIVGDPHEAVAEGQLARVAADSGRADDLARPAVQARDGAVAGVGDPGGALGLDHATRAV